MGAGSKGLGRISALRLGTAVTMRSWARENTQKEHRLKIDWTMYEGAKVVEEVPLAVEEIQDVRRTSSGTLITIENLRQPVSRPDVGKLARSLILLADPFGDDPEGFKPTLKAPDFRDLEKLVQARYFEDSQYHPSATVDKDGNAKAAITDWKGKAPFQAGHADISTTPDHPAYQCPERQFDLCSFILTKYT